MLNKAKRALGFKCVAFLIRDRNIQSFEKSVSMALEAGYHIDGSPFQDDQKNFCALVSRSYWSLKRKQPVGHWQI